MTALESAHQYLSDYGKTSWSPEAVKRMVEALLAEHSIVGNASNLTYGCTAGLNQANLAPRGPNWKDK